MKRTKDTRTQKEKFIAAAREHGCDESEDAFNVKLKAIASVKPKPKKKKKD